MSRDDEFLRIMDDFAKAAQSNIHDANARLHAGDSISTVFLEFMERAEVAMTLAKEQLRSGV
jgi:hypothetical protein